MMTRYPAASTIVFRGHAHYAILFDVADKTTVGSSRQIVYVTEFAAVGQAAPGWPFAFIAMFQGRHYPDERRSSRKSLRVALARVVLLVLPALNVAQDKIW